MKTTDELNQEADQLADKLLKDCTVSVGLANARMMIRIAYKEGVLIQTKESTKDLERLNAVRL